MSYISVYGQLLQEDVLYQTIKQGYNKNMRPAYTASDVVDVHISFMLGRIESLVSKI